MFQNYNLAYCDGFSCRLCYEDSIPAIAPRQIMKISNTWNSDIPCFNKLQKSP